MTTDLAALEPFHLDPGNVAKVTPVCCHPTVNGGRCTRKAREGVFVLCGAHFDQALSATQRLFDAAVMSGRAPEEVLGDEAGIPGISKYRYLLDKKRELGEYLVLRPHVVSANYGRWCDDVFRELQRMDQTSQAGRMVTSAMMQEAARRGYEHLRPHDAQNRAAPCLPAPAPSSEGAAVVVELPPDEAPAMASGDLLGLEI